MLCLRRIRKGTLCEFLMRDDQLRFLWDCTDGAVRHRDILIAVLLEFLAQCCRTEC